MKIIKIYSGIDGESHFEEIDMALDELHKAKGVVLRQMPAGDVQDWHPAPCRQYVVTLVGECEIEVTGGIIRKFRAGDIMLADDTSGHGHITRTSGDGPRIVAMIPLD